MRQNFRYELLGGDGAAAMNFAGASSLPAASRERKKEEERWVLRVSKDEDDVVASAASSRAWPRARLCVHERETAHRCWTAASRQLRGTAAGATVYRLNLHLLLLSLDSVQKLDQLH